MGNVPDKKRALRLWVSENDEDNKVWIQGKSMILSNVLVFFSLLTALHSGNTIKFGNQPEKKFLITEGDIILTSERENGQKSV